MVPNGTEGIVMSLLNTLLSGGLDSLKKVSSMGGRPTLAMMAGISIPASVTRETVEETVKSLLEYARAKAMEVVSDDAGIYCLHPSGYRLIVLRLSNDGLDCILGGKRVAVMATDPS